jgi:hypothetical protein
LTQTRSVLIGVLTGFAVIIVLLRGQTQLRRAIQLAVIAGAILASMPFIDVLIARRTLPAGVLEGLYPAGRGSSLVGLGSVGAYHQGARRV